MSTDVLYLEREGWSAREDLPRLGHSVDPANRTHVIVHHTVMVDNDNTSNEWESISEVYTMMQRLQTVRSDDLGADVPYSLVAFCMSDGGLVLCEGRGLYSTGAHTTGHNTKGIGIAFAGDFENGIVPIGLDNMLPSLGKWLDGLKLLGFTNLLSEVKADSYRRVFAHSDFKATACPGKQLMRRLSLI